MSIFDVIDPTTTTRIWTVDGSEHHGGKFDSFWLKRNAIKCFKLFCMGFYQVSLCNEITGKTHAIYNSGYEPLVNSFDQAVEYIKKHDPETRLYYGTRL